MTELLPTYDKDIEQVALAGLMTEANAVNENPINPDWFYIPEHQKIARAIISCKDHEIPIDIFQVQHQLKAANELEVIGGIAYLFEINNRVASAFNLKHHLRLLVDLHTRRNMAAKAMRTYQRAFDLSVDVDDLIKEQQSDTLELMEFNQSHIVTLQSSIDQVIEQARRNQQGNCITGARSGLAKLDHFTGGFQAGDLVIIAGETSQGKTAFAVSVLKNLIRSGHSAVAYSLEMTHRQLTARIIAQITGISSKKILTGILSREELASVQSLKNSISGLYYDERSTNSIDNICASMRRLKMKYNIDLAVVDFIQIVSGNDRKSDEGKLADIARKLKNVAKELGITVLALSQLNRNPGNPEPSMARLRGSGQIEEAADLILLLYRPEVYEKQYPEPFSDKPTKGTAMIDIAKGRNVGTGSFLLTFNSETTGFYDYGPAYMSAQVVFDYHPDRTIEPDNEPF